MIIKFSLTGDYAHFSHPATIYSSLSYPLPPKTAVMGLLGAIIGLKEYYKLEGMKYSVKINKPLKKKTLIFNGIKNALSLNMKLAQGYQNSSEKKQFYRELICSPSYTVYLDLAELSSEFKELILTNLKEHKCIYTPYLGINFCIADFEFLEIYECKKLTQEFAQVCTFVLQEDFVFEPDRSEIKLTSSKMACAVEDGRVFKEFKDFIVEISSKNTIKARNKGNIYEIDGECVYFV